MWGTDPAPAASPLQSAAPAKAAAVKIKQTDYTKPDAGGILKPQAPVTDVPVSTAPVSNRTALFGAKDTPDLTLAAKKLEQMGDLYREFSPQQRALLDDYYKDDPASLNVIRGRTTGNDWLLAQSRAAQQREQTRAEIAAQRKAQTVRQLALDPTVQADARRSGEILITPGAGKAVTQNTQPAYYSTEMFRNDSRRAEVAAERKEQALKETMQDPAMRNTAMLGRELVTMPGSLKEATTEANKEVVKNISEKLLNSLQRVFPKATRAELWDDLLHFDPNNQNENTTLSSNWFSAYKGVLVIRAPAVKSSLSYGAIFLDTDYADKKTLNHEYGHVQQLKEYGLIDYTWGVAIPSLLTWFADCLGELDFSYYDAPWEAEADEYGGVVREKSEPWPEEWYRAYDLYHNYLGPYFDAIRKRDTVAKNAVMYKFINDHKPEHIFERKTKLLD